VFKRILVPIDVTEPSSWARSIPVMVEIAQRDDAHVTLVSVLPMQQAIGLSLAPAMVILRMEQMEGELNALRGRLVPPGVKTEVIVRQGSIYSEILSVAREQQVDLIVMASHRPEMKDYLIGTNAARVVRHAACSVLVVRD
jgi:nucleotide-binding universal stress UspA family protein